jgi:hypothetical protein
MSDNKNHLISSLLAVAKEWQKIEMIKGNLENLSLSLSLV